MLHFVCLNINNHDVGYNDDVVGDVDDDVGGNFDHEDDLEA